MAFPIGLNDRYDDSRFRNSNGVPDDAAPSGSFAFYSPPIQTPSDRYPSSQYSALNDARASLQRRFTTNNVPLSQAYHPAMGQSSRNAVEPGQDLSFALNHKVQLLEKKKAEYDYLRKKKLQFQREMDMMELQAKRDEAELQRLHREVSSPHDNSGNHSEPTTPPDHHEPGFPTVFSKPNRFSASTITSPPGLSNRTSRTGSQVTSPPTERARTLEALTGLPSTSGQGSRRNSDEEEEDSYDEEVLNFNHRSAASLNRNSMPVTRRDLGSRNGLPDLASNLGPLNTSSFLLEEDDDDIPAQDDKLSRRGTTEYLHMQENDDQFPVLVRRDKDGNIQRVNSSSTALDLALSPTREDSESSGWSGYSRQGSRASMPLTQSLDLFNPAGESSPQNISARHSSGQTTPVKTTSSSRHSMGAKIGPFTEGNKRAGIIVSPTGGNAANIPPVPKLSASFSTSSVPTVKNLGLSNAAAQQAPANITAEQRLHNHNASLGRIPVSALNSNRHSRDLSGLDHRIAEESHKQISSPPETPLPVTASPFGLAQTSSGFPDSSPLSPVAPANVPGYGQPYLNGYPMQMLNNAMSNLQVAPGAQWNANPGQWNSQMQVYPHQYPIFSNFQTFQPRVNDSQPRNMQQRRTQGSDENARFANITLENLQGEIYGLCKDQHGCRFLQKKLEDRKPENIQMIFEETKEHIVELMTDPFGNYLCQKLLEFTDKDQRTTLINNAAPHMVKIALNQHGTRALQKMIEYVSTPEQIQTVTVALQHEVVQMIQDLNGNHVIQKCLNHLKGADAQFIFDSVARDCIAVGSHRHGTCVIQRCVDHAQGAQKNQLIAAITSCALPLAEDAFGNYVIQYIFDQNEDAFSHPLSRAFIGNVVSLSKQKFSSNVIEKCLRVADAEARVLMTQEIIDSPDFERVVDDTYANYVVQTAWDFCTPEQSKQLAEKIRPLLPRIRHKPYGRRFQTRISDYDRRVGRPASGTGTPSIDFSAPDAAPLVAMLVAGQYQSRVGTGAVPTTGGVNTQPGFTNQPQSSQGYGSIPAFPSAPQQQGFNHHAAQNFGMFQERGPVAPQFPGYPRPSGPGYY